MEMLSSATKMDIFPTFLQSEKDFDEDFNYITSSGTTLGEMLSTENFLESYVYDSKSPDDTFADEVVYDANDFVTIIKQEPTFEYRDYQMKTSPESDMSAYEDQLQLVNTSNDLMSVDLEYLMNLQKVPSVKQENASVLIKVEAQGVSDESVPVVSHEVSAELSSNNGLQYLFEGGIVKAEKEFDWKTGFEDIDCVVPSLFMDASSNQQTSQFVVKCEPTVKNEVTIKREVTETSRSPSLDESFRKTSTEKVVDIVVSRHQTDSNNRISNSEAKRSAPEMVGKPNKKLKKPVDNEERDERLKKAVNNVKLRQQKKFEEGRLCEQKRQDEAFQKKARERAQYFSKQIASGALQLKPVEEKEDKRPGCLQKKRGRKPKAVSSEQPDGLNASPDGVPSATSLSCKVKSLSDLSSKRSFKGNSVELTSQPSSSSLVVSTSQEINSVGSSLSKRSPKAVLLSSSITSTLCQVIVTSASSVKRSPSMSSLTSVLPSESSASSQVKSLSILSSKGSPTVNDVSLAASGSVSVSSASCILMKAGVSVCSSSVLPAKLNTSSTGNKCGKQLSILRPSNMKPRLPFAAAMAKGGISILKSAAAHASSAVSNSASKSTSGTLVTFAAKAARTSLLRPAQMPVLVGTSVLRAPPPTQLQNLPQNDVSAIRLRQETGPGVQSLKFGPISSAVTQNPSGQKPWNGTDKIPDVNSGNVSPSDLVKSETAETVIARSTDCQSVAEKNESRISTDDQESKQSLPVDIKEADLMDDDANECNQMSTTGTVSLTESRQDGNNNDKKNNRKKRLNLSEYMNRLKERSKNEFSETKSQVNESFEANEMRSPCMTNENLDSVYSVLAEHNYCIRAKQPHSDAQSEGTNSSESTSGRMIISISDNAVVHLKGQVMAPAGITCRLPSSVSSLSDSKVQSVHKRTSSGRPLPDVKSTNGYGSLQPRNPVTHNGKISSQPRIASNRNQDTTFCVSSAVSGSTVVNYANRMKAFNQVTSNGLPRQTPAVGQIAYASNSASSLKWKLIPHNLKVAPVVSFRNAIGQKFISSNDCQSSQLEGVNLNDVVSPSHVSSSVDSNAGNEVSMFDCESSSPSKEISCTEDTSREYNSHQPFSDASSSQDTFSTASENSVQSVVTQSCRVTNSVSDSLPSDELLLSSCALTLVSTANHCASSSSPSTSDSVNQDNVHRTRTSRRWRRSQSSRSSRSSSSDSYRSRSPIRQTRRRHDESSSSSYCSRSPSRQRHHRDYKRNGRYNWYEKKWRSDNIELDDKDKIREKKIYVGGIPDNCTPLDLKERFKHFGEITKVSVHPQTDQENYGFLTFRRVENALRAKEGGHKVAGCESFHFCYGDRRAFCKEDYKDFDNMWNQSWDADVGYYTTPKQSEDAAFEDMLKAHLRDPRRMNH